MFKRKQRGTCSIHGDYDGEVCGFCTMGNRLKSLDRNALIQRIEELEALLKQPATARAAKQYAGHIKRIEELEAENKTLHRMLAADPDRATSTGASQAMMGHQIEMHSALSEHRAEQLDKLQRKYEALVEWTGGWMPELKMYLPVRAIDELRALLEVDDDTG